MKLRQQEALSILGLGNGVTFEEIKKAYRKACSHYHPDRNAAGLEMMKLVNAAWTVLQGYDGSEATESDSELNLGEDLNRALNAIITFGLNIEVCGTWIWVSGDTRPYKDQLKEAGFRWAPKKVMWCYAGSASKGRGKYSMDEIRSAHGSVSVKSKTYERLSA